MIEFKQIVGRGTRLFDGKDYFTIYDFVKAYEHFNDPEWDGDPVEPEPCARCGNTPCTCEIDPPTECPICGKLPCECAKEPLSCPKCGEAPCVCQKKRKLKIKLADGKERTIQHMMMTMFYGPDGKPISSAEFVEQLFGALPDFFKDEDELRTIWSKPDTRKKLLSGLEEKGYGNEQLTELKQVIDAEDSDLFDVLAYIAFTLAPISREERVESRRDAILERYNDPQQEFLDFVLAHYIDQGVGELDQEKLPGVIKLKYGSPRDAEAQLGSMTDIRDVFVGFQKGLYVPVDDIK